MNLLEFMEQNNLYITDYSKTTIIDVVRTIYNHCGTNFAYNKKMEDLKTLIKSKKHILLIMSDGMGSNLIDTLPDNSILKENKKMDIQTVNPSTTGCAIPSIVTGEYPEKHGMLGWLSYYRTKNIEYLPVLFKERKTKKDLQDLDISLGEIYRTTSVLNKLERRTYAVFPNEMKDSAFSTFVLNKGERLGYETIEEAFDIFENIRKNENDETFTYMYLPQVDSNSHKFGVFSNEVYNVINKIEKQLNKINFDDELEIIIIADHGQTDVKKEGYRLNFDKYQEFFYALPGIDSGTATYYIKEGKEKTFEETFNDEFAEKMFLFKTDELINNNVFGPSGLSDYMKSNLGEYISICRKGEYFINSVEEDELLNNLKGTHSGFSKDEIITPLIVLNN